MLKKIAQTKFKQLPDRVKKYLVSEGLLPNRVVDDAVLIGRRDHENMRLTVFHLCRENITAAEYNTRIIEHADFYLALFLGG